MSEAFCAKPGGSKRASRTIFSLSTPDQIIQQFHTFPGLIGLIAIATSALGLLVGGSGVMNIMLVSVTERTREIGLRKALGARRFDIVAQFIAKTMVLIGAGGDVGIVVAIAITLLVGARRHRSKRPCPVGRLSRVFGLRSDRSVLRRKARFIAAAMIRRI